MFKCRKTQSFYRKSYTYKGYWIRTSAKPGASQRLAIRVSRREPTDQDGKMWITRARRPQRQEQRTWSQSPQTHHFQRDSQSNLQAHTLRRHSQEPRYSHEALTQRAEPEEPSHRQANGTGNSQNHALSYCLGWLGEGGETLGGRSDPRSNYFQVLRATWREKSKF